MWDERYTQDGYLFGTKPASFLSRRTDLLRTGAQALAVGDGEGRNSVFLAERGLEVTAMDVSPVGVAKARRLAEAQGVTVDYHVADVLDWEWVPNSCDIVVGVFIQFLPPDERAAVFQGMQRTLRPGGRLLLHGYRPEQVDYATGGPPDPDYMYTEDLLRNAFQDFTIEVLDSYDARIEEGTGHVGMSALIDLVARKE